MMRSWPRPFTRKICSVMMAPPKMVGMPSAIRVTTGIMLLRSTWNEQHHTFAHALGAGGAYVVEVQVVEHRGAHEAAELRRVEERQHHHRHGELLEMHPEAGEVGHPVGGVVDGRQPLQHHAEDDDREQSGEEGRHREPHHGHEGADLVEPGVLPVGGDDADGDGDEDPPRCRTAPPPTASAASVRR